MSGYLIAVIIMLIMFVALMIRLLEEPAEEAAPSPSIQSPVPASPTDQTVSIEPTAAEPATLAVVETETVVVTTETDAAGIAAQAERSAPSEISSSAAAESKIDDPAPTDDERGSDV